jgi:ATP-dependent protease ClpP protease subunit
MNHKTGDEHEECSHAPGIHELGMLKMPDPGVPQILSTGIDEKARTLYMVGDIDDNKAYQCLIAINYLDQTDGPIKVIISSGGGIEYYGYAIYDALRNARNPIIAEGYGIVASMAAAIFQAADVRYMSENCEYMIHNGSIDGEQGQIEQDAIEKIGGPDSSEQEEVPPTFV